MTVPSHARLSVLCVTHDPRISALHDEALINYDRSFAETAFKALSAANKAGFDAYILDYWLPDMSGIALCKDIRRLDPRAPIVFHSGVVQDGYRARAIRAGADAFLAAPTQTAELLSQLGALLSLTTRQCGRAKRSAERTVEEELRRWRAHALEHSTEVSVAAVARAAHVKALKAFIAQGGTRANFERWWAQIFDGARSTVSAEAEVMRPSFLGRLTS